MSNTFIDGILNNIDLNKLNFLVGTDELRCFNGKRLKEISDNSKFYISVREFSRFSDMTLHSGVLTSFLHSSIPDCCIARMTRNISYILLCMENGKCRIISQKELSDSELKEYKERVK